MCIENPGITLINFDYHHIQALRKHFVFDHPEPSMCEIWRSKANFGGFLHQSGTKPNLVTVWHRLPKLVVRISSQFQHLVNTGLEVGSLVKRLTIKVANTCKSYTIWVIYCSPIVNGSIRLQSPLTHCAYWYFTSKGVGHFSELFGAHT